MAGGAGLVNHAPRPGIQPIKLSILPAMSPRLDALEPFALAPLAAGFVIAGLFGG